MCGEKNNLAEPLAKIVKVLIYLLYCVFFFCVVKHVC
jgi:hypothetical protein